MYQKIAAAALVVTGLALAASGTYLIGAGDSGRAGSQTEAASGGNELLSHVPADTIGYSGYTDGSLPITAITSVWGQFDGMADMSRVAAPGQAASEGGPGLGILVGVYNNYLESLAGDARLLGRFGLDPAQGIGAYAVGALPVLRIGATDTERFWRLISDIETASGIDATPGPGDAARSRRYAFATDGGGDLALVIATHDGDAVMTLAGSGISDDALSIALGTSAPARSLAASDRLNRLAAKHGLLPGATGFIDHRALVAGLTGDSKSRFGAMLSQLSQAWGGNGAPLALAKTPACRDDARAIAKRWPYTALGLSRVANAEQRFDSRLAVAVTNEATRSTLRQMRGHIPQPVADRPLVGLGVGLDIPGAASAVQALSQRFTAADFQCPALQQAQKRLEGQPTSQLGMVTSMLGAVRGAGLAVTGIERGRAGPSPVKGDAVLEVASSEPGALWQFAKSTLSLSPSRQLEPGGDPVTVDGAALPGVSMRVALRDNALLALVGDAELDGAAGESDVEANGIMRWGFDYSRLAEAVRAADVDQLGGDEARAALRAAEDFNVGYETRLDVTDTDLRLDLTVTAETP